MKIKAVTEGCVGHARCAAVAPALFELDDDGFLRTPSIDVREDQKPVARHGVRACPERILSIE